MITISRRQARRLRGLFRRSVLGIGQRGPTIPPLVFRAEGSQLRAQHRYNGLAVKHSEPGVFGPQEAIALPLDALADVEGKDDSPVVLEAVAPDRTVVRWEDRGIPQCREYAVTPPEALAAFPEPPRSWTDLPGAVLDALAEATATGSDDSTRYALNCLQLGGASRQVVATDGRQLLVQGGFGFPWTGDVLVRRSPVFASKELPRDRPVSLGRTETHVVIRSGPWTLFLEVREARFPRIEQVVPDARGAATRLHLDGADAAFLLRSLDRLPGGDEPNAPATVDLNGAIAIRARENDSSPTTELILGRSWYSGPPVRLNSNRAYLARALRLGFTTVEVVDADTPLVCRDGDRVYAWQPLSKDSALAPSDDAVRIESVTYHPDAAVRRDGPPKARIVVREPSKPVEDGSRLAAPEAAAPTGLAALIREAEALHETLSDARSRTGRLVVALRRQRRRERLVSTTLASLKALKLQDVAE